MQKSKTRQNPNSKELNHEFEITRKIKLPLLELIFDLIIFHIKKKTLVFQGFRHSPKQTKFTTTPNISSPQIL